jgi:hypothetical protein
VCVGDGGHGDRRVAVLGWCPPPAKNRGRVRRSRATQGTRDPSAAYDNEERRHVLGMGQGAATGRGRRSRLLWLLLTRARRAEAL